MTPHQQQVYAAGKQLGSTVGDLNRAVASFGNALNYRVTKDLADMAVTLDGIKERQAALYSQEFGQIAAGIQTIVNPRNKQLATQLRAITRPHQQINTRLQHAAASDLATIS